ncbi:MAG: leader peptidase (prepilin peptidase)/N-methyltransferase [Parasphingorhabdus sp.]|jgi:leader peptidase (prepilin peptidase)/N-methyltransferase
MIMEQEYALTDTLTIEGHNKQPDQISLARPASACPHCKTPLRIRDNIPLISYLLLGGRCAHCSEPISGRYPIVELITGLLTVLAFYISPSLPAALAISLFCYALLALTIIDLEHYLLPDFITLPLMWAGLLLNQFYFFTEPGSAVFGAAAGYLSLWSIYHVFKLITGKEGLGYGDFKLLAALGAWVGWQGLPLIILMASMVGAIIGGIYLAFSRKGREHPIPFGPFLCSAGLIGLLFGDVITSRYFQFLGIG